MLLMDHYSLFCWLLFTLNPHMTLTRYFTSPKKCFLPQWFLGWDPREATLRLKIYFLLIYLGIGEFFLNTCAPDLQPAYVVLQQERDGAVVCVLPAPDDTCSTCQAGIVGRPDPGSVLLRPDPFMPSVEKVLFQPQVEGEAPKKPEAKLQKAGGHRGKGRPGQG